jgi:hypothetical protein
MRFSTSILSVIVCAALVGWTPDARAEDPPNSEKKSTKKRSRQSLPADSAANVESLEELVVVGRIQKPEVFYVLGRTDFRYRGLTLKKSFVDRISGSIRKNPF